jgi:predicted DsbA family dithiol-disulfide isomerase
MARKTTNGTAATKVATSKSPAARKSTRSKAATTTGSVAKKSTEIKARRAGTLSDTAKKLRSAKVLVPLAVAVGVGLAAVRKMLASSSADKKVLPRIAKEVSPRFSEAVSALAELGRELRAKIR